MKLFSRAILLTSALLSNQAFATDFEFTPFIGYTYSDDVASDLGGDKLSMSNDTNYGFAFAWQDGPNGQGMILINRVSHNFTSDLDNSNHSLDITYAHFNGVAMFRQANYITTVSLGLGGAYFDVNSNSKLYPSFTAAIGSRYEISKNLAFVTEIRTYASLTDKADKLFCQNSQCTAQFSSAVWLETNVSVGFAYKW